ncbi:putative ribonuclease H-like domain-containing protein [Tanacetum coccineum]
MEPKNDSSLWKSILDRSNARGASIISTSEDPQFPDKVYKVEKALYGLHQAPRAWYETLSTYLFKNGFRRGTIDKTLFIKKDKVKRIFRYLKGQPKLGLWYPMDSPFDLEAFSDSDYAGASLDRIHNRGPTIYASYIEQFWNTATSKTVNSVKQIHAIVDGKAVVISESSVRSECSL